MQYVTSTSFLLLAYAKYLTSTHEVVVCGGTSFTPKTLRCIAKRQVDYILGDNPMRMAYMVGYGARYPERIHHRGLSLPSKAMHQAKIQCSSGLGFLNSSAPNPNVHVGAVVGGPDLHDRFADQRTDYEHSEPSTYINAPLVGALAYLAHSFVRNPQRTTMEWKTKLGLEGNESSTGKEVLDLELRLGHEP